MGEDGKEERDPADSVDWAKEGNRKHGNYGNYY